MILPPVAAGDLVQLAPARGDTVVIVDGFFRQQGAVRHKEILHCLDRGAVVVGAASIGALRAAELRRYGMVGVGRVFEAYASGELEGDDEVTVAHHDPPSFLPVSEALVNVREQLRVAQLDGCIAASSASAILADARARTFSDRTWPALLASARRSGAEAGEVDALEGHIAHRRQDVKRNDALQALAVVRAGAIRRQPPAEPLHLHTVHFDRLWVEARRDGHGGLVSQRDVLNVCRLDEDHGKVRQHVLLRELAAAASIRSGCVPPQDGRLLAKFWEELGLPRSARRDEWLAEQGLGLDELTTALRTAELARLAAGSAEEPSSAALRGAAVRHLREIGMLPDTAAVPSRVGTLLSPAERALPGDQALAIAATRAMTAPHWVLPLITELKISGRYTRAIAEARAIVEFAELTNLPNPRPESAPEQPVSDWLRARWGLAEGDLERALLDRGFSGIRDLALQAYPHFIYLSTVATASTAGSRGSRQGG